MPKIVTILLAIWLPLCAEFLDDDMDGVPNESDHCPHSALTDIVDSTGCKIDQVHFRKEHRFDITLGLSYSRFDANTTQYAQSVSLGYYYGNFSAWFYSSDYTIQNGQSGIADTTLAFYYRRMFDSVALKVGTGGYIPTADTTGNRIDYFLTGKVGYYFDTFDLSFDFQHTFMQDIDTKDTDRLTISAGYIYPKAYTALSYTTQNSIYDSAVRLDTVSLYVSYFFNSHWFATFQAERGVSNAATDVSVSWSAGYYF